MEMEEFIKASIEADAKLQAAIIEAKIKYERNKRAKAKRAWENNIERQKRNANALHAHMKRITVYPW